MMYNVTCCLQFCPLDVYRTYDCDKIIKGVILDVILQNEYCRCNLVYLSVDIVNLKGDYLDRPDLIT